MSIDQALLDLEAMVAPLLGASIMVREKLDAGSAKVAITPKRLDQVLLNLMLNARDSMVDGGTVEIRSSTAGDSVLIEVVDDGAGIPESQVGRVFEPFFTTREGKPGLGLWVCESIVSDAGGELAVRETSGSGTTMGLRLPLTRGTNGREGVGL